MLKSNTAKFATAIAGVAFALSAFASTAGASTLTDLQAELAAITAQIAALQGGSSSSMSTGYTFNTDLTIGSTGPDVVALQNILISKGLLTMPAGVAEGYFGTLTQNAVAAWQASAGISPAAGYFGPKSRAALNAMSMSMGGTTVGGTTVGGTSSTGTSSVAGCAPGAMYSSTTGAACGVTTTTTTSGVITTPGAEGILSVTAGPISNSVVNVGAQRVPILTIRAQAQGSDIAIQRITVDLGTNTTIFNKIYQNLYLIDNSTGNVIAGPFPLNASTVVQSGTQYVVNLTGFSFVVPKDTYKDIGVAADLYSSINTPYLSATAGAYTVGVDGNGVRGIDGAGIDQYGPNGGTDAISQAITINASLLDNTIANISTDASTPQTNSLPVTDTTNNQYLQLPVLTFDLGAQNDAVHIHNLAVNVLYSGTGSVGAAYLYQGSTQISSASVIGASTGVMGTATFTNIADGTAGASVPINTTLPYTIKVDVSGVTAGSLAVTASTTQTGTTLYNSQDENVNTTNGIAQGNTQTVLGKGPAFSILGATIAASGQNQTGSTQATSTVTATFTVSAQAIGTNVYFGTQASTSHPMFTFKVFNAAGTNITGTIGGAGMVTATSSGFIVPTGQGFLTTGIGPNSFELPQQQTGTLSNITYTFAGKDSTGAPLPGGPFSVEIASINYTNDNGITNSSQSYMDGLSTWRTPSINVN